MKRALLGALLLAASCADANAQQVAFTRPTVAVIEPGEAWCGVDCYCGRPTHRSVLDLDGGSPRDALDEPRPATTACACAAFKLCQHTQETIPALPCGGSITLTPGTGSFYDSK